MGTPELAEAPAPTMKTTSCIAVQYSEQHFVIKYGGGAALGQHSMGMLGDSVSQCSLLSARVRVGGIR